MAIRVAHALDVVWRNVDRQQVPFAQQKAMGSHDIDQRFALGGYNGTRSSSGGSSVAALGVGYKAKRPHLCSQSTGYACSQRGTRAPEIDAAWEPGGSDVNTPCMLRLERFQPRDLV